ncbi:MAG: hypothetical protein WEC75_01800 [Dehalococcoidia bacterium]
MAYYEQRPPDGEPRYGCLDVLVITRAVFGLIMWPFVAMVGIFADVSVTVMLFAVHPALALIPIALTAAAIGAFARWDRRRGSGEP